MSAIWTFLNSPVGIGLLTIIASKIIASTIKDESRREKLQHAIDAAFQTAEMIGVREGLKGNAKYLVYAEQVWKELKARGEKRPLTDEETITMENAARQRAYVVKERAKTP